MVGESRANAVAVQYDGNIVLGGQCGTGTNTDFCVVRYLSNGTLDPSWNGTGKVVSPIGISSDYGNSLALQPDGKVLLAGLCQVGARTNFCAARYLINGALDTSWNSIGTVITAMGLSGADLGYAVALQPNGKVLLAGGCSNGTTSKFCVARYDAGPFGFCTLDIDGDGSFLATTDALIATRISLGITGPAVIAGIVFPANATRNSWPLIRNYLVTQCGMSLVQ